MNTAVSNTLNIPAISDGYLVFEMFKSRTNYNKVINQRWYLWILIKFKLTPWYNPTVFWTCDLLTSLTVDNNTKSRLITVQNRQYTKVFKWLLLVSAVQHIYVQKGHCVCSWRQFLLPRINVDCLVHLHALLCMHRDSNGSVNSLLIQQDEVSAMFLEFCETDLLK